MNDVNAAPSSTEPAAVSVTIENKDSLAAAPIATAAPVPEAGTTVAGEPLGSGADLSTQTSSGENSISMSGQSIADRSPDSSASASLSSESLSPVAGSSGSGDAPVVAMPGESPVSTTFSSTSTSSDAVASAAVASTKTDASGATQTSISSDASAIADAPASAHRWLGLLERKLSALEHDARDELLDVVRQLREAL